MKMISFGKTGMMVSAVGFGAIPIQRIPLEESTRILCKAFDAGVNFYDTARVYSDSEEKIGVALGGVRDKIIVATKSISKDYKSVMLDLEKSLSLLQTDYVDIYQLHNPEELPKPGDGTGTYEALLDAKKAGKILHIGITNHRLSVANEAVESGLYETLQFPLSCISSDEDFGLADRCVSSGMGFIAMKALAGGLISNTKAAFAFLSQYDNVVPIWGIQRESELDEFIEYEKNPPALDSVMLADIKKSREELSGSFCRGCGYCMPCPAGIPISFAARLSFMMSRARFESFLEDSWAEQMERIKDCQQCGQCKSQCPYKLDTPALLVEEYEKYIEFRKQHNL